MADDVAPEEDETTDDVNLGELQWVREQLREVIPDLAAMDRVRALAEYRKLVGQITAHEKAINSGTGGAAGKLEAMVGDAPSGAEDWEDADPPEVKSRSSRFDPSAAE